ncbi:MAG: glycosyltransferase 87 family protein [Thermoplasmatota archaeon]
MCYLLLLILTAGAGSDWSSFKLVYMLWFLTYVGGLFLLMRSQMISRFEKLDPVWISVILFTATFLLHLPFLLGDVSLSQDILRLEKRGELLMDGRFPYRDFDVNKPPLYIWMVGALSLPFGPDQLVFRVAFSIASSLVPVVMYLVHRRMGASSTIGGRGPFGMPLPGFNWMTAAIAYMLCPIPLMETGMGGHFDPVVVLVSMVSFLYLVRKKPMISGIFLGAGFALKLYPMFLAPIFFLSLDRWSDRIKFTGSFFLVPVLASLPVLFVDPSLMAEYLRYQFVNWYSGFSIRYLLEIVFSGAGLPEKAVYYLLTLILLLGTIYLLVRGFVGKFKRVDVGFVFALLQVLSVMGVVLSSIFYFRGAGTTLDRLSAYLSLAFSILVVSGGLYVFLHWRPIGRPCFKGISFGTLLRGRLNLELIPLISSCILLLVVLTSAQFHPWYIAWVLPFSLASGNEYWGWSTLLLMASLQYNYYPPWELAGF